jgi:hypothetical protein
MLTTNEATDIRFELGIPLTPPFPVGKSDLLSKASTLDNSQILPIHNQKNPTNTNTNSRKGFHRGGLTIREAHKFFQYSLQKFSSKDLYMMFFYLANTIDW